MKIKLFVSLLFLLICTSTYASYPTHQTVRTYHTASHEFVGYLIARCDGTSSGPGPTAAYDHIHAETDLCAGGVPAEAIGAIAAVCSTSYQGVDAIQACIKEQIELYHEDK